MNRRGPFIIIEDDREDQEVLEEVLKEFNVRNATLFFQPVRQLSNT